MLCGAGGRTVAKVEPRCCSLCKTRCVGVMRRDNGDETARDDLTVPFYPRRAPKIRALLYPHFDGDPLPQVEYTDTQIELKIGSQQHVITLDGRSAGRTVVSVKEF